jgi:2-polyprenyl-3-methyl-5-hydroxy-6-metoxy-1,4-benzoquinol methylase
MRRLPPELLERMAERLRRDDCDEMAIPSYLHGNPAMRWMAWRRVEELARMLDATLSGSSESSTGESGESGEIVVMDFGCGTGVLFEECSRLADRVFGVDLVLDAAKLLVEEWGLEKVHLATPEDAEAVVPQGGVDVILAGEVLEHIEPLEPTLEFFSSRLRPGGKLLVSVPTESALYRFGRRLAGFHGHYHLTDAASVRRSILAHGFREDRRIQLPLGGPFSIYWVLEFTSAHTS